MAFVTADYKMLPSFRIHLGIYYIQKTNFCALGWSTWSERAFDIFCSVNGSLGFWVGPRQSSRRSVTNANLPWVIVIWPWMDIFGSAKHIALCWFYWLLCMRVNPSEEQQLKGFDTLPIKNKLQKLYWFQCRRIGPLAFKRIFNIFRY